VTATAPLRVLLVEDQEMNRSLIHAIVDRTRHPLIRDAALVDAHDLAQARAAIAADRYDVVLLDVQLPDGSGLVLLADLVEAAARPIVIALTGGVLPHQRAAALAAGCDAFLDKPFLAADLITLLERLVPDGDA
jgi:two-component system KDP operon response regulator KdpE